MQVLHKSIHQLASTSNSSKEFFQRLLKEVADEMSAEAGLLWDASGNPFQPAAQFARNEKPSRIPLSQEAHSQLLLDAAAANQAIFHRANTNAVEAGPSLLMVGQFQYAGKYLVELFLNGPNDRSDDQLQNDFSELLGTINSAIASLPETSLSPNLSANASESAGQAAVAMTLSQEQVGSYLHSIHTSIDRSLTCSNVANETRRLLECDRVSVVLKHRGKFRIFAISGQPSVNRRSNTTKLLEKLAGRLLKTGQSFWYPGEEGIPTQIGEVLDEYLSISATRSLVLEPIFEKVEDTVVDPESLESKHNRVIGGIIYEHCHERWERSRVESVLGFATTHSGNAVRNAKQHHSLFLYPILNFLGKSRFVAAARILPKTLMVCAAILLVALVLVFWPVDFYVTADGILVPNEMRPVFSKVDGDVSRLLVEHGSVVKQGDPLLVLTSREHEIRLKDLESQIESTKQRLETIQDQMFDQDSDDSRAVQESIAALRSQIANFEEQQTILKEIDSDMAVSSPLTGKVISWDLEQRLQGRAIQRGQELMEVAAVDGDWELEIELPVNRYCHLVRELESTPEPKISFLLAADTSKRYFGKIVEVETTASINSNNEQFIRLRAKLEASDLDIAQARTGVTTKIYSGRTSLGYFWLHDIGEFLQKNVLFHVR